MRVLEKSAMPAKALVMLVWLLAAQLGAQGAVPSLLLLTKEKIRVGKLVAYDTNESRIASTCARLHCPHAYLALKSISAPDEIWWLTEYTSAAEKASVDREWQSHPAMKALQPLSQRKDTLRQVIKTTLFRRIAEASPGPPWSIAGTRFLLFADGDIVGFPGSVYEAADGRPVVIAAAADLTEAQARAAPYGQRVSILAVERRWSFPAPDWVTADSAFWRPSVGPP